MKKIILLNLIFILMINLLLPSSCFALSQDQQYSIASFAERLTSSNYNIFYNTDENRQLGFARSGFFTNLEYVNYVYKTVFPLTFSTQNPIAKDDLNEFVTSGFEEYFDKFSINEIQRGDIVVKTGANPDIAICVKTEGEISVVSAKMSDVRTNQIQIRSLRQNPSHANSDVYFLSSSDSNVCVLRLKEDVEIPDVNNVITDFSYYADSAKDTITYEGIPLEYEIEVENSIWTQLINTLMDFFNNILGTIFKGIQIFILSILGLIERILSILRGSLEIGEATLSFNELINSLASQEFPTGKGLSFVDIIFNRVPILDVNFVDINNAGGKALAQNSIEYIIRENVAGWYYALLNVATAVMVLVLIYVAIKIAISVIPQEEAKYKKGLADWGVSLAILIFMHFIIIAILTMNNMLLDLIANSMGEGDNGFTMFSFAEVATSAKSLNVIESLTNIVVYIVIIYTTIRFLIMYFHRLFKVMMLTIFSPLMVISYAIERMKGSSGHTLMKWVKVYAFNVLIQSVHALIFSIFLIEGIEIMRTHAVAGALLLILLLSFVYSLEGIFKNVFNISDAGSEDNAGFIQKMLDKIKK